MNSFVEGKLYRVYRYTQSLDDNIEGELMGYVRSDNAFQAVTDLGLTPEEDFGATRIGEGDFEGDLDGLRERLSILHSAREQLQGFKAEAEEARKKWEENPTCPNCGGDLTKDEHKCTKCDFGHEDELKAEEETEDED